MLPIYGIKIGYLGLLVALLLMVCFPVPGISSELTTAIAPGLNVIGIPSALVAGQQRAFPLLALWQSAGVTAIESHDPVSGKLRRAELDGSPTPSGADFPLVENSALYVYSTKLNTLPLGSSQSCAALNLSSGFNLASYACFPSGYLASNFINSVGLTNITSLSRLDLQSGRWQTAAVSDGTTIVGEDFPLVAGEGYIIHSSAVSGWSYPSIGLNPATLTVWQGQPGAALTVSLPSQAPTGGTAIDIVSSNPALASASSPVIVPQGATSATVPLTLPDTGIATTQSVTVTASRIGMTSAQATLSVHPKPVINLSPLTTLTGLSFTYLLTINLSDVAPPGGFPVTLTATPSGVVSVPASVTIPAGASSTQVTVTATTVGSATISATSPGRGTSGSQNSVTVKPIQTMNYGPLISPEIGIQVGSPATASTSNAATYTPVASAEVGVAVGSLFTGVSPNHGAIGSTALPITIRGVGLDAVTGISLYPAADITIGALTKAPDGLSAIVLIDIAATAAVGDRTVMVSTATGNMMPSRAGADIFKVTYQTPEIYSIQPIRAMVGQAVTMTINGRNLNWASSIDITPAGGILISNPPTVDANGKTVTVTFTIAADASLGNRVVTVTTSGGTSSAIATPANTFAITSSTDPGANHTMVAAEVGVLVQIPAAATTAGVNYGPTASLPVGVTVGSIITSITPVSAAIGATGVKVRALGVGLNSATAISFYPSDGINIQSGTFAIGGDGNPEVTIDIAANAPVTLRTVIVALPSGYALPSGIDSDKFRITLPTPEIYSIQPIRGMVGQAVTLTVMGKNFASASSVDFTPSTGINVINPPTISADGKMITSSITLAANAPLGDRVVTVNTPGGTSSTTASTSNTFTVTSDPGFTYSPLVSPEIGVLVSQPNGSNQVALDYGPVTSSEIGVMVTPVVPPTSKSVDYGPVISTQVGVAVGALFTGFMPAAMEPGSSVSYMLKGIGLDAVTSIALVPSANVTVTSWIPAGDGLTGTVTITADSGAVSGMRTMIALAGSSALPSLPGKDILFIGYKPIVNSITTSFPASSVQATVGNSYTLTLNGSHLQGVTKVEVIPPDGITINSMPSWSSDVTGEHVSITMTVDANAAASDRLVLLTTTYGSSNLTPDTSNTLSIFRPLAVIFPAGSESVQFAANKKSLDTGSGTLTAVNIVKLLGLSGRKCGVELLPTLLQISCEFVAQTISTIYKDRIASFEEQPKVSRGPPIVDA